MPHCDFWHATLKKSTSELTFSLSQKRNIHINIKMSSSYIFSEEFIIFINSYLEFLVTKLIQT
jgi:hypothetical protein